jgi:DNA-binding response OmpR family regulator
MTWAKILVIDDDADVVDLSRDILVEHGFDVAGELNGRSGLTRAGREHPDLILLDLMLPDMSGFEVCRALQRDPQSCQIPIIIVTARDAESDLVLGLGLGADDYVVKPFTPGELVARVKAVLRRIQDSRNPPSRICREGLVLDARQHQVQVEGQPVALTATEFRLLHELAANPGVVQTRAQLVRRVIAQQVVERTVDVHVRAIRRKLRSCSHLVETVRGIGYRFKATS